MGNQLKGLLIAGIIGLTIILAFYGFWVFVILSVLDILRSAVG